MLLGCKNRTRVEWTYPQVYTESYTRGEYLRSRIVLDNSLRRVITTYIILLYRYKTLRSILSDNNNEGLWNIAFSSVCQYDLTVDTLTHTCLHTRYVLVDYNAMLCIWCVNKPRHNVLEFLSTNYKVGKIRYSLNAEDGA